MGEQLDRDHLSAQIARLAAGDRTAIEPIYRLTSGKLFGVCLRILNDRDEAQDVLQEVYITLLRKADSFDSGRASPITWLATIARNRSIDRLRSGRGRARTGPIDLAAEISDPSPLASTLLEQADDRRHLDDCLDELDPKWARAIRLAFLDGETYEHLADRMNMPLGTLKGWVRRGLMKLRTCLER